MVSNKPIYETALHTAFKAQQLLVQDTPQLQHAASNSAAQGLPHIAVGPAQGQFLAQLCKLANARQVLEVGTLGGYSTIWLATSVPGVQVTSIEYSAKHAGVARDNTADLDNVNVLEGAALDVLPTLAAEARVFDVVFIDADWDEQAQYFDWAVKLTRPGGIVYVDNVLRQITETEAEGGPKERAWRLIEFVRNDARVVPTIIPVLNTEKVDQTAFDAFLMALVK